MKSAIEECVSDRFALYRGDCVEIIREIPDSSIHYSAYSPPFRSLYVTTMIQSTSTKQLNWKAGP
jgi:hypothetical protein